VRRWPLLLIASPAAVAVWSGWVGLGSLCGFGVVHPLPGIWDGLRLNTAITLPIGVESYGAYALGTWLTPGVPETARRGGCRYGHPGPEWLLAASLASRYRHEAALSPVAMAKE